MSSQSIRYMIVDDEPIAHRIIEEYCQALPRLQLSQNCYNALEALDFLHTNSVDLIFLDINMPKLKGFDFLRTLQNPPKVIVTSAYQEFALEGYELNVCDYLLKPFSMPRFLAAVNKALLKADNVEKDVGESAVNQEKNVSKESSDSIYIKGDRTHFQICIAEISHIEACGNYCLVFYSGKKIMTLQKISQFEKELPEHLFIRVHKSHLVAKKHITSIASSELHVLSCKIPIGHTYKENVQQLIPK
jgi:two-component system, LytTR family, response regulator LytT